MYLVVVTTIATFIPMNFVFINSVVVMGACVRFEIAAPVVRFRKFGSGCTARRAVSGFQV